LAIATILFALSKKVLKISTFPIDFQNYSAIIKSRFGYPNRMNKGDNGNE